MIIIKDINQNLLDRTHIFQLEPEKQDIIKKWCENDILAFFNMILYTYDPRSVDKTIPFITYPFQDDYILWTLERINKPEDALTEKSRDMGVSWMMLGIIYWLWLFKPGFNALVGSYIEGLIDDKNNMDTHFGRLQFMIQSTPNFLLPKNYEQTYMKLYNGDNGNTIIGYAPTEKFSRAGRYSLIWADEFAFWQHGRAAWTAMSDATKCRIVTSTVNGKGNKFADLALKSNIAKKTLHWRLHPLKDDKWYEEEAKRRTTEEMAQEIDINYNKAVTGRVYPEFTERNYQKFQPYNPLEPLFVSWDFGINDPTAIVWLQRDNKTEIVRIVDVYQNNNKAIDFFVPFITGEMKTIQVYQYSDEEFEMIQRHKQWQAAVHYGDPTGR